MGLDDLDLNLLRTLDVLLAERSVSRAARRLDRSQPAVSHALRRLRDHLGDPLLVRDGRSLALTPRAESLAEPLHHLLGDLGRLLDQRPGFTPETTTRTFRLASPPLLAPLLPDLLHVMHLEAPHAGLEVLDGRDDRPLQQVDVRLGAMPDDDADVIARRLGTVEQTVILRAGHPALDGSWGLDAWLAWPHVLVRTADRRPSRVARALAAHDRQRTVGLIVPDLLLAPHVVARSDLFFTGPAQVLAPLAAPLGLVLRPPPVALPGVPVAALWHPRLAHDPGHRWFRAKIVEAFASHLAPLRSAP